MRWSDDTCYNIYNRSFIDVFDTVLFLRSTTAETAAENMIVFEDVSKFYGDVLGINRVSLQIAPASQASSGRTGQARPR